MRQYELMLIVASDFPHDDEKKREELIKKLFTEQTMENLSVTYMGKKALAYEINKKNDGVYFLITFSSPAFQLGTFEQHVKLNQVVMRYLLTRKD